MKKGMTLIEVIIALALVSIISLAAGSMLMYGVRNYRLGVDQRDEQFNIRYAADQIADKAKVVSQVGVYSNPGSGDSSTGVLYYLSNNRIVKVDSSGTINMTEAIVASASFTLRQDGDAYYLEYTITSTDGYSLDTRVQLLNINGDHNSSETYKLNTPVDSTQPVLNLFYNY